MIALIQYSERSRSASLRGGAFRWIAGILNVSICVLLGACQGLTHSSVSAVDFEATRSSAASGDASSQHRLGVHYDEGVGVKKSPTRAVTWYRLAARRGYAESQYALGQHYREGNGVVLDPAWGARWLGKAAYQDLAQAQFELGMAYASGVGLPQEDVWARRWLSLGQRNGADVSGSERTAAEQRLINEASDYSDPWVEAFTAGAGSWYLDDPTIRYVQIALKRLDYPAGRVDGSLGPQTLGAIREYRTDAGLPESGTIDADAIRRLRLDFGDALPE